MYGDCPEYYNSSGHHRKTNEGHRHGKKEMYGNIEEIDFEVPRW